MGVFVTICTRLLLSPEGDFPWDEAGLLITETARCPETKVVGQSSAPTSGERLSQILHSVHAPAEKAIPLERKARRINPQSHRRDASEICHRVPRGTLGGLRWQIGPCSDVPPRP